MSWIIIITLIVIGLLFLILEILVLPGTTVAGIIGGALIVVSIWQTYVSHGTSAGHYTVAGTFVLTFFVLYFSLRSKTWKKLMLNSSINSRVNVISEKNLKVGDAGRTISRLAPAGKARINDIIFEVRTMGDFIDQESDIVVVKINRNKIIVKLKT